MIHFYFSKTEVLQQMLCSYLDSRNRAVDEHYCKEMLEAVARNDKDAIELNAIRDEMFQENEFDITNDYEALIHLAQADDLTMRWVSEENKWKISCDPFDDVALLLVLVRYVDEDPELDRIEYERKGAANLEYDRPRRALGARLLSEDEEEVNHLEWFNKYGMPAIRQVSLR